MDIAALSMTMNQNNLKEAASIAVMKMAMNVGSENNSQLMELMNNLSLDPNLGTHIDIKA
ncbi:YjfB family protein [Clostridium rectalis]|uniref:YjfB family protein n=1 Tax=Clostridium rectalis TaxID=2040295 RepID=UPI000F642D1F|nr:YjfB family protein [Clostridium rectalis]